MNYECFRKKTFFFSLFLLLSTLVNADAKHKDFLKEFPSTIYQPESATTLYLNGIGISNAFSCKAYVGAIYLTTPTSSAEQILEDKSAKRISLYFVREKPNMRDFFITWLEAACQNEWFCKTIENDLQTFKTLFYKSRFEDKIIHIDYLPEQDSLKVTSGSKILGSVQNSQIFYYLLRSWLGDYPPSKKFKEELLVGIPTSKLFELTSKGSRTYAPCDCD